MTSSDLRHRYDLNKYRSKISQLLLRSTPREVDPTAVGYEVSGLECLAVMIRHIYAWVIAQRDPQLEEEFREMEKRNPILAYAWNDFEADEGEGLSRELKATQAETKRLLLEKLDCRRLGTNFQVLASCSSMNNTIWARDEFVLYRAAFAQSGTEWRAIDYQEPDAATASVLYFTGDTWLQDFIDRQFGIIQRESLEIWCSNRPRFVRMIYQPDDLMRDFSELRSFTMPIADFVEDGKGGMVCDPEAERHRYNLIAVVRLQVDDSLEYIRTYSEEGAFIQFDHPARRYWDDTWRVSDKGQEYYLLYQRWDDKPNFQFEEFTPANVSRLKEYSDRLESAEENQVPMARTGSVAARSRATERRQFPSESPLISPRTRSSASVIRPGAPQSSSPRGMDMPPGDEENDETPPTAPTRIEVHIPARTTRSAAHRLDSRSMGDVLLSDEQFADERQPVDQIQDTIIVLGDRSPRHAQARSETLDSEEPRGPRRSGRRINREVHRYY